MVNVSKGSTGLANRTITSFYKKENVQKRQNYEEIMPLSTLVKIFARIYVEDEVRMFNWNIRVSGEVTVQKKM